MLDIAARIVFGVSVMDRQIKEYLARKNSHLGDEEYELYVRKIHKMKFASLAEGVRAYIKGKDIESLFDEIKKIRRVRNAIAHSTADVDSEGTVRIDGEYVEAVIGRLKKYSTPMLAVVLESTNVCSSRLKEFFEDSQESIAGWNDDP